MSKTKTTTKRDAAHAAANATTAGADHPARCIIPRTLQHAAHVYEREPRKLGEVLIALATGRGEQSLDKAQRVLVAICREELSDRERQREANRRRVNAFRERERQKRRGVSDL